MEHLGSKLIATFEEATARMLGHHEAMRQAARDAADEEDTRRQAQQQLGADPGTSPYRLVED